MEQASSVCLDFFKVNVFAFVVRKYFLLLLRLFRRLAIVVFVVRARVVDAKQTEKERQYRKTYADEPKENDQNQHEKATEQIHERLGLTSLTGIDNQGQGYIPHHNGSEGAETKGKTAGTADKEEVSYPIVGP